MPASPHDDIRRWLAGEAWERAAWASGALLAANPGDLDAWYFAGSALGRMGRRAEAVAALRECAEAAAESGNLPAALACHVALLELGESTDRLLEKLADLYHREAPRVRPELRLAPPLPADPIHVPETVDHEAAVDRAIAGLKKARDQAALDRSMTFDPSSLPAFPLFGSLSAQNLVTVLRLMDGVYVPPGGLLVEQGTPGEAVYFVLWGRADVVRRARSGEETVLRRLAPGAVVGEIALVTRAPRIASIRSVDGLLALRLPQPLVEDLADKEPTLADELVAFCQQRMLANLVDASPILRRLDDDARIGVLKAFDRIVVPSETTVVRQGEPSGGLYLIVVGEAEVLRRDECTGETLRLAQLGPADAFGEMSLLLKRPATATVRTVYDCAMLTLPRERFLPVVEAHPELLAELYRLAQEREEETQSLLGRPSETVDDLTLV